MTGGGEEKSSMQQQSDEDNASDCHSSQDPPLSSSSEGMKLALDNDGQLPSDLLIVISEKLDLDDIFSSSRVCKDWRTSNTSFWGYFMASQAPLVIEMTKRSVRAFSFLSISDGKTYNIELPELYYLGLSCAGFSSGYLILASMTNTPLLVNPFTRRMKKIPEPSNENGMMRRCDRALLAFAVDSEEFVIVALRTRPLRLHVYQSRNSRWVRYSDPYNSWNVADVVVLHRTLYAITVDTKIGVLSLNSPRLKILQFSKTPRLNFRHVKLVSSDGQLLVLHFPPSKQLGVYRIDFAAMEWDKLETLGDRALFLGRRTRCYALSKPGKWGYDSNCLYYIDKKSRIWKASPMNNVLIRNSSGVGNGPPSRSRAKLYYMDWCFRHLREEIDYSLDD